MNISRDEGLDSEFLVLGWYLLKGPFVINCFMPRKTDPLRKVHTSTVSGLIFILRKLLGLDIKLILYIYVDISY